MKPHKQGVFSRFCGVYSTINALQLMNLKLNQKQNQSLYDYIIGQLNVYDSFFEVADEGADYKRLEAIFVIAGEWMQKRLKKKLVFERPFWSSSLTLDELLEYASQRQQEGKAILMRVRSDEFDHYSIFLCKEQNKLKFFDSSSMPSLPYHQTSTAKGSKYQIMLRQVYVLSLKRL